MSNNPYAEIEQLRFENLILTNALVSLRELEDCNEHIKEFIESGVVSPILSDTLLKVIDQRFKVVDVIYDNEYIIKAINSFQGELITFEALSIINQNKEDQDEKS